MTHVNRRHIAKGISAFGIATAIVCSSKAEAEPVAFSSIIELSGGVRLHQGDLVIDVLCARPGMVSVVKYREADAPRAYGFFLKNTQKANGLRLRDDKLSHGDIEIAFHRSSGGIGFTYRGRTILTDLGSMGDASFDMATESDLYGLGQFRDGLHNYRDKSVYLAQGNSDAINPVLVSPDRFGLLWETGTDSHFSNAGKRLSFSNPSPICRYHVLLGATTDDIIARYRNLTGRAPLLPKYAYGFWQSQERYNTQTELTDILDGYRSRRLPVDVMVQDWAYWGSDEVFSGMVWDKDRYPNPKAMCEHVHALHAHVLASVWPAVGPKSEVYKDLAAHDLLLKNPHWSGSKVVDITNPEAQDIYWTHIRDGLLSVGIDGLWTDGSEPEFMSTGNRYVTTQSYVTNGDSFAGPLRDNALTFSYYQARLLYTRMRQYRPSQRPVILTRSVYAGQQAFNAITWSGDIFAGWETFRNQVTAAQQISISGIPYWTDDIGGFLVTHRFPEGLASQAYLELYVRWFQFGAFLPIFRAHGTQTRRELWAYGVPGEPHFEALKTALELRYALMPYIYELASRVTFQNETVLRPLVMDFAKDAAVARHPYQFMFGRDLLVCPVVTPLYQAQVDPYEFIPNYAVTGADGPAAEVTFFAGADFETKVETRYSDDLKMSWFGDLPAALKGKPYSAIWKGKITAQDTGLHKFRIITQGLIRFTLEGEVKVASAGSGEAAKNQATGAVSFAGHNGDDMYHFEADLVAGRTYTFELTQSQPKPDAVSLWVEWITPTQAVDMQVSPDKTFEVYLPAGNDWYELGDTERLHGGQTLSIRPELGKIPVYVRAGAVLPMTLGLQYANETPTETELHVYPGRDGRCDLYEDGGDGFGYEAGEHASIPIRWTESRGTLTIGPVNGHYPGMPANRRYKAIYHGPGKATAKMVEVQGGKPVTVKFGRGL